MWNEIIEQPSVLKECLAKNEDALNRISSELKTEKINYIIIAARGTSDHAAVYAKYMFETLAGIPVAFSAPSVITTYKCKLRMNCAFVIGISQSGEAKDVIEVLKEANRNGVPTVGITNFKDSPLAKASKYLLLCDAGLEKSVAATKTFTTQMALLGMLAAKYAKNVEAQTLLASVPKFAAETIASVKDQVAKAAERYRFINECVVLARGLNYAVALESALKIEETTYARAKAFAASDFHHGPMAILQKDIPVIAYAPSGPALNDMRETVSIVKEAKADLFVVSDNEDLCRAGDCFVKTPNAGSDIISPFINSIVAQMFACKLANIKGLNPDMPRMLHKVTITV